MSVSLYRGQVDRLTGEAAALETKAAGERDRAAKERGDSLRIAGSITKSTSASAAQSKARDAQRHEERAVQHDRQAAQYANQSATKRRALSEAQNRLGQSEAAERKKLAAEGDKRRRDDQRRLSDLDRARRAAMAGLTESSESHDAIRPAGAVAGMSQTDRAVVGEVIEPGRTVARLPPETTADATLEIAKAVALGTLSSVPVLGPILREVVGVSWGDNRAERLQRFATELARDVEALMERLDRDFVKRDEFQALAEETLERVVLRRNEQKIPGFSAAVAHSATIERPDQRRRERFLDWLDQLRPIHLEILRRFEHEGTDWVRPSDAITVGQVASSRVGHALNGLPVDPLDLRDLEQRGLIYSLEDSSLIRIAGDVRAMLTPMGREFLAFISMGAADSGAFPPNVEVSSRAHAPASDDSHIADS